MISGWDEGIARVRNSAKWILVVVAAAATFVFGAGTLGKRPELSWHEDTAQLGVACFLAVAAVVLLSWVVYDVAQVFRPEVVDLTDPEAAQLFAGHEQDYFGLHALPGVAPTVQLASARSAVLAIEEALAPMPADPEGPERTRLEGALAGARAQLAEFTEGSQALLDAARYLKVQRNRQVRSFTWAAAAGAVVLGIGYQLVLSTPTTAESSAPATPAPGLAVLSLNDGVPGAAAMWAATGLDRCAPRDPMGRSGALAAVWVVSGSGTADSPYTVRTLPWAARGPGCAAREIQLPPGTATVSTLLVPTTTVTIRPTVTWSLAP